MKTSGTLKKRAVPDGKATDPDSVLLFEKPQVATQDNQKEQQQEVTEEDSANSFRPVSGRPVITPAEEQRERELLTEEERIDVVTDMFGKFCTINPATKKREVMHGDEAKYTESAIEMMRREMEWIPNDSKSALIEAKLKCGPEEFSDARLETFLRVVDWYPKVSICARHVLGVTLSILLSQSYLLA